MSSTGVVVGKLPSPRVSTVVRGSGFTISCNVPRLLGCSAQTLKLIRTLSVTVRTALLKFRSAAPANKTTCSAP
eukprot:5377419-Pyramimonas_sp.AAC.1